jgi:hypothetical protein
MAWPLMFSTAGITYGTSCEPMPMLMDSGMGRRMWVASLSLLMEIAIMASSRPSPPGH